MAAALSLCEEKGVPLDQRNSAGETPLFYAAARCFSCFLCLVNHGVNRKEIFVFYVCLPACVCVCVSVCLFVCVIVCNISYPFLSGH